MSLASAFDAAYKGDDSALSAWVVRNRGHVDDLGDRGASLLYTAARFGHFRCAHTLVINGFGNVNVVNSSSDGSTPLHGACYGGHPDIVALLMAFGAFTEMPNKLKETPKVNAKRPAAGVDPAKATLCAQLLDDPQRAAKVLDAALKSESLSLKDPDEHE